MPTPKKVETVRQLQELLERTTLAIAADYRGLSVADITALRRRLREVGVEFRVVKNTLARLAAQRAERPALIQLLEGPTALALGFGEQVETAKALTGYLRSSRLNLTLRGAALDSRVLDPEEVTTLASLPPRQVLLAQVVGGIQTPLVGLVTVLQGVLGGLVRVLDARVKQLASG